MKKLALVTLSLTLIFGNISTVFAAQSLQNEVITSSKEIYKLEKERVYKSIKLAKENGRFYGDYYGIAWSGELGKDEHWDVSVYELDQEEGGELKFSYKAPWNYTYYEDILTWYPSLMGKDIMLIVSKNGVPYMNVYPVLNTNKINRETFVPPIPECADEITKADFVDYKGKDSIIIDYNNKKYILYKNGNIRIE